MIALDKEAALAQAAAEHRLASYYRDNVRPLLRDPEGRWPRCCGGGCEPCNAELVKVARRTLELMGSPRQAPDPL